jgi:hypothetical protein
MASARQGGQKAAGSRQRKEERDSPVGAAFSRDSNDFFDLPLTAYCSLLTITI